MLISEKDILDVSPPFLMKYATGNYFLITNISRVNNRLRLDLVEKENGDYKQRSFEITDFLFYVGEGVWELEYGSILMTLEHPSLANHTAKKLWQEWYIYKQQTKQ